MYTLQDKLTFKINNNNTKGKVVVRLASNWNFSHDFIDKITEGDAAKRIIYLHYCLESFSCFVHNLEVKDHKL